MCGVNYDIIRGTSYDEVPRTSQKRYKPDARLTHRYRSPHSSCKLFVV